jgi:hypothetical protein
MSDVLTGKAGVDRTPAVPIARTDPAVRRPHTLRKFQVTPCHPLGRMSGTTRQPAGRAMTTLTAPEDLTHPGYDRLLALCTIVLGEPGEGLPS